MPKDFFDKLYKLDFIENLEMSTDSFKIDGDNLILTLKKIDLINKNNLKVIFKNIKNRSLISCDYKINNNDLIIDLTNIKFLSTDYEYSFYLVNSENNHINILFSKSVEYSVNTIPLVDNSSYKYKWYIRVLKNGEFRISTISIFINYYDVIL